METTEGTMAFRDDKKGGTVPPEVDEDARLIDVVRRCYDDADGDWDHASKLARDEVTPEMVESLVWTAIRYTVRKVAAERRGRHQVSEEERTEIEKAMAKGCAGVGAIRSWCVYNFPLPGGKLLGTATKEDLLGAADFYRAHGETIMARAEWFTAMAKLVKADQTVKECIVEDKIEALREKFGA